MPKCRYAQEQLEKISNELFIVSSHCQESAYIHIQLYIFITVMAMHTIEQKQKNYNFVRLFRGVYTCSYLRLDRARAYTYRFWISRKTSSCCKFCLSSFLCPGVEKQILKRIKHFHYMTYKITSQYNIPCPGIKKIITKVLNTFLLIIAI